MLGETHCSSNFSGGTFVVLLPGGLPGNGWDQKISLLSGILVENYVILKNAEGERSYLAQDPSLFSATNISTFGAQIIFWEYWK